MIVGLKKFWRRALAGLLAVVAMLVWLTWPVDEPFIAEFAIPGSTERIRFLKTEMGPLDYQKTTPWAGPVMSTLRRMIPVRINAPYHNISLRIPSTSPLFLFSLVDASGKYPTKIGHQATYVEFVDSNGFIYGNQKISAGGNVAILVADSIPRRDRELHMRVCSLFGFNNRSRPWEIKIPNPFYQEKVTEWTPQPMETTVSRGDLRLSLQELSIPTHRPTINSIPFKSLEAKFKNVSGQLEWDDAQYDYWFEDATGNRGMWPSPFEPAWKVAASVHRHPEAPHPTSMITDLGKIKIPPAGQIQILNKTVCVDGFNLKLICVCGGGTVNRANDKISASPYSGTGEGMSGGSGWNRGTRTHKYSCGQPFLLYECDAAPAERKLFLRQNSFFTLSLSHGWTENSGVKLHTAPGETEYSLELVDSRPEQFEFVIAPPEGLKKKMLDVQRDPESKPSTRR